VDGGRPLPPLSLTESDKATRQANAWHLYQLGWSYREIGDKLNHSKSQIEDDVSENSGIGKIGQALGEHWNAESVSQYANHK